MKNNKLMALLLGGLLIIQTPTFAQAETAQTGQSTNAIALQVGVKDQKQGDLVLSETGSDYIESGKIILSLKEAPKGLYFSDDPIVETTGGLKVEDVKTTNTQVIIEVKRGSSELGSLIVKDFIFTVDRTVAEGTYDLEISGSALSSIGSSLVIEDFIQVSSNVTGKDTIVKSSYFTIGEASYKKQGEAIKMDAAPYLSEAGYTMVPLRYVAEAMEITGNNLLVNGKQVTLIQGSRTLSVEAGNKQAFVNGAKVEMKAAPVIKEGRMYLPLSSISSLFGYTVEWEGSSKTATITTIG